MGAWPQGSGPFSSVNQATQDPPKATVRSRRVPRVEGDARAVARTQPAECLPHCALVPFIGRPLYAQEAVAGAPAPTGVSCRAEELGGCLFRGLREPLEGCEPRGSPVEAE